MHVRAAKRSARLLLGALMACAVCIEAASAQTAQPATRVPMPDTTKITLLIQTHMAALGHGNLTGNYSVLHALGSPAFQGVNSPAKLAANFAVFRAQGIDISPTILLPPLLNAPPRLEAGNVLRVSGQYDTKPQRVVFEMAFQAVDNAWRLAGIAVSTVAANQAGVHAPAQAPSAAQAPKAARTP
jgi:hypothetical protein